MITQGKLKKQAGLLVATALAADGVIHLYWATGHTWPARDERTLSLAVLNKEVSFGPRITLPLAGLLISASLTMLARVQVPYRFGRRIPRSFLQAGVIAIAGGLLLRGVAGIGWSAGWKVDKDSHFYRLNRLAYTPLCLVLLAATLVAAPSEPPR